MVTNARKKKPAQTKAPKRRTEDDSSATSLSKSKEISADNLGCGVDALHISDRTCKAVFKSHSLSVSGDTHDYIADIDEEKEEAEYQFTAALENIILQHILTRFPPKFLIRCSCVSKYWSSCILDDPHLASSHFLENSQKNPCLLYKFGDSFYLSRSESDGNFEKIETIKNNRELIGSCNGLVCLLSRLDENIELCNPVRHQIMAISRVPLLTKAAKIVGFGYDSLCEEYKVVIIQSEMPECMVLSIGSRKNSYWKAVPIDMDVISELLCDPSDPHMDAILYNQPRYLESATFFDGVLYWGMKKLVSFNLHQEEFQVIELPKVYIYSFFPKLVVHKGFLCCASLSGTARGTIKWNVELFMLVQEEDGQFRWKKENFKLPYASPGGNLQLVSLLDTLLLHRNIVDGQVIICNLHTAKSKKLKLPVPQVASSSIHMDNLLSLHHFEGLT